MRLIDRHLDLSQPDPPVRDSEYRVSHVIGHMRTLGARPHLTDQICADLGIPVDAVLASFAYHIGNRPEIEQAIEDRNTAYQDELGNE